MSEPSQIILPEKNEEYLANSFSQTEIIISTPDLISVAKAAEILKRHRSTVHRWKARGRFRPVIIGHQTFITRHDLDSLIKQQACKESIRILSIVDYYDTGWRIESKKRRVTHGTK